MKRISFEELLQGKQYISYEQQYAYVMELLKSGNIKPVKASGKNGKKPALYREYWLMDQTDDMHTQIEKFKEELKFDLVPAISINYYIAHLEVYQQERPWVLMLNTYLKNKKGCLCYPESVNERSFEIWGREKFLSKEQGKKILKHCGIAIKDLYIYETTEPLSYYSHTRETPQNLLILENKDTFYSMRRHLLDGAKTILGIPIGTLIYGSGKGILRSFLDFDLCVEPYMKDSENTIYYFGDLDYEGIGIYESLIRLSQEHWNIEPCVPAYLAMLKKAEAVKELPDTKEQQNRNIRQDFFKWFQDGQIDRMKHILESGKYIPQEILNITDF